MSDLWLNCTLNEWTTAKSVGKNLRAAYSGEEKQEQECKELMYILTECCLY